MLNRTNRTLSANLNRLNLGTRSLVLAKNGTHGGQTLRFRHDHGFAMRAGMFGSSEPAIRPESMGSEIPIGNISGSSVVVSWPISSHGLRPSDSVLPTVPPALWTRLTATCSPVADQFQPDPMRSRQGRISRDCKSLKDKQSKSGLGLGGDRYPSVRAITAAAVVAAAGG